ncbi:malonyl CoA-acyl carrier protein transacylase [Lachnospiraceae bacterium KM106-2]|nr:malonyl CoA-acyl carrier protein transacylase [Lachnospiraceae bacterium KM106-2]
MNKIAFIYPGQGAQYSGMGKDFYEQSSVAKAIYDKASERLDFDLLSLCFQKDSRLNQTEYTQPALVATELAITAEVMSLGLLPDVTAGLSLGEYTAIATAGGMDLLDAISLVRKRGIYMEEAVPAGQGSMAAILGLSAEQVENAIEPIEGVSIANYNCPGQIVITGLQQAVQQGIDVLLEAGAKRAIPLIVSGPFHSKYLKVAGDRLEKEFKQVSWKPLTIPYVTNVTAQYVRESSDIAELLVNQVSSSVRWQQSIEKMIDEGVTHFIEIGPGKTLSGFMRKIDRTVSTYHIGTMEEADQVIGELVCRTIR